MPRTSGISSATIVSAKSFTRIDCICSRELILLLWCEGTMKLMQLR